VQMAKNDPEAQRKSSLSDCTWLENEYGSFNLEALKLCTLDNRGVHFIFMSYILIYFFLFLFFSLYSLFLLLSFFHSFVFLFAPLEL
jgi:hypothetical protein